MILASLFIAASLAQGLPPDLLSSLCFVESGHNPKVIHKADGNSASWGICQVKLATARQMGFTGKTKDLLNPEVNIEYAAKYLSYQLKRYKGNYARAVNAYNKGSSPSHGGSEYLSKVFNEWAKRSSQAYGPFVASHEERR